MTLENSENKIEIPLSKFKIILLLLGALAFLVLGVQFILHPDEWLTSRFNNSVIIKILGIVTTIFSGMCAIFIGRKLFDKRIGLTIDDRGITDNTNATSVGLIEWKDIEGFKKVEIESTKIIILRIYNKKKYIERAKNKLAKHAMKANDKMYGSPISIIASSLKIKFKDLEQLLETEMAKRDKNTMKFFD